MTVVARIPQEIIELDESTPIGLHIRKRRLERNLTLDDASNELQVCVGSLCKWESGRANPRDLNAGTIIRFLGYDPYNFKTETLGQRIRAYRFKHGYTLKQLGDIFGVTEYTMVSWEADEYAPKLENMEKLNKILENM